MLIKFLRLRSTDRVLLLQTFGLVALIRLGLWVLPFRIVRTAVARLAAPVNPRQRPDRETIDRIVWAVTAASRRILGATCLTQALSSQVLLQRRGCPADLRIGVAKADDGELVAHAWIEVDGKIVIGGSGSARSYTTLSPPER